MPETPFTNVELPDLPLGRTLAYHLMDYLEEVIGPMASLKAVEDGIEIDPKLARIYAMIYEDLQGILEFVARERHLALGGSSLLSISRTADRRFAFFELWRDGEKQDEFPYCRAALEKLIAKLNRVHADMVQSDQCECGHD